SQKTANRAARSENRRRDRGSRRRVSRTQLGRPIRRAGHSTSSVRLCTESFGRNIGAATWRSPLPLYSKNALVCGNLLVRSRRQADVVPVQRRSGGTVIGDLPSNTHRRPAAKTCRESQA